MDSIERVFLALEHKTADRIPIDFWASKATVAKLTATLGKSYEEFLDRHDVDLRYIEGPRYVGPHREADKDVWGVGRITVRVPVRDGVESYTEVAESPLAGAASVDDIERYPGWPSPDWFDYSVIEEQCDAVRERGRVVVFMGDRLNRVAQLKPAMYLRGMEDLFIDLAANVEVARAILRKIKEFYLVYLERILEAAKGKIDIVLTGDDFGSQNGPLLSPAMWRDVLKPGFAEYLALIRHYGVKSMHHTCGSVVDLIPDMIECGLDVLQSIQPSAAGMSFPELYARFGDRLCFHGGVCIQQTMPFGTPAEIRAAVKETAEVAKSRGGYIFCTSHNIQADTTVENTETLLQAYHEFGRQ
ncbi:MAG TPA: uroporphyrinogen decarboxylase family protein [Sumerlaeia bacterium]|nr:uroporphyrinogen decarboxylase family protein [Sumerlaeia bacterium]